MKQKRLGTLIGLAATLWLVFPPTLALSHDGAHEEGAHATSASHADAKTAADLWRTVKTHETELQGLVESKDLGKVHEVAFAIRDSVAGMADQSPQLSPEQLTKLKGNVKYVATLAERLDASGDAKDQAATERNLKQLESVLSSIEALYPAGALK
jgi:hypothetical protein